MKLTVFDFSKQLTLAKSGKESGVLHRDQVPFAPTRSAPGMDNLSFSGSDDQKPPGFDRRRGRFLLHCSSSKVIVMPGQRMLKSGRNPNPPTSRPRAHYAESA